MAMKKVVSIVCILLFVFLFSACSVPGEVGQERNSSVEESQVSGIEMNVEEKGTEKIPVSDTKVEIHFFRDGIKIHGELHLPKGEGPFPVVVFANGLGAEYDYQADYVRRLNERGLATVIFDFIGTSNHSRSGGDYLDKTFFTEVADLNKVLDEVLSWSEIDVDKVFLWGHSFGGLVSTYVAGQREEDIQGLILLEPSYYMSDQYRGLFPEGNEIPIVVMEPYLVSRQFVEELISVDIYEKMPDYENQVLIFQGTVHGDEELEAMKLYYEKAVETFSNARLVLIEGADHFFQGETGMQVTENAIEFIADILKEN